MDVHLRKLAAGQDDLVAAWQLMRLAWTRKRVLHHARRNGWRQIHDGVFAMTHSPLTQRQRWIAAVLTAPDTFLAGDSAATCHGYREWSGSYETVVRPGSGGKRRFGDLLVARSTKLEGSVMRVRGIPVVTAERALIDIAPDLGISQLGRAFRESIRLRTTTANDIARALRGQRGTSRLRHWCDRYATIPYHRCRSDAESRALEILHDAAVPPPQVNVKVGGIEADLVWRRWRFLVEVDGREFHLFSDEDARKEFAWRCAGYDVHRIPAATVYARPNDLVSLVNVRMCAL